MRFAFGIGNHFANFCALINEQYPFRVHPVAVHVLMATRPSSVSPTTGEGWKLTHLQWLQGRYRRDAVLHCVLHLREGAHLDLAYALARDTEFLGQLHERDLFLGEPARLEDAPLALVEHGERIGQRLRRLSNSSRAASVVSWSGDSSTSQSCHSPESPSSRIAALSEASPLSRRFM